MSQKETIESIQHRILNCENYCESSVTEYKVKPHNTKENLGEFLKDIISLLNCVKRPEEDRYLIYGIDDKRQRVGYVDHLDDAKFQDLFGQYIEPMPFVEFHEFNGENFSENLQGKKIACFYIPSSNAGRVYEIKKKVTPKGNNQSSKLRSIEAGSGFTRHGSQVVPIMEMDRNSIRSYRSIEHLLKLDQKLDRNGIPISYVAAILGGWNEDNQVDIERIEKLTGLEYKKWVAAIIGYSQSISHVYSEKNGVWTVSQRSKLLRGYNKFMSNDLLELLKLVFDDVFYINADAIVAGARYSSEIQRGIAEFLAIIGNDQETYDSSRKEDVDLFISGCQSEILASKNLSSIEIESNVFELLSEASPQSFLDNVSKNLNDEDSYLVRYIRKQYGFTDNQNLQISGIFAAICVAAREESLFFRAIKILQKLSKFSNVADVSIINLLSPESSQAAVTIGMVKTAAEMLLKNNQWDTLVKLLPYVYAPILLRSCEYRKPNFPNLKINQAIIYKNYVSIAVEGARGDGDRIVSLVKQIRAIDSVGCIPKFMDVVNECINLIPEDECLRVCEELDNYLAVCDEKSDSYAPIKNVTDRIRERDPFLELNKLFDSDYIDSVKEKIQLVIDRILQDKGESGLCEIATRLPHHQAEIGVHIAESEMSRSVCENFIYAELKEDSELSNLIRGFVRRSFEIKGASYLSIPVERSFKCNISAIFFSFLPCEKQVWEAVEKTLGDDAEYYWKIADRCLDFTSTDDITYVLNKYLCHDRVSEAIKYAYRSIRQNFRIDPILVFKCVKSCPQSIGVYNFSRQLTELFYYLSQSSVPADDLIAEEIRLYNYLNATYESKNYLTIHRKMAADPHFFLNLAKKVILLNQENSLEFPKFSKIISDCMLLPGFEGDSFNAEKFDLWILVFSREIVDSGNEERLWGILGEWFYCCPCDESGFFINLKVAKFLDENALVLKGYFRGAFNSNRNVLKLNCGGRVEYFEVADELNKRARSAGEKGFPELATTLFEMAKIAGRL